MKYAVKVSDIMTHSPITLSDESTIDEAVDLLNKHNFHHLPILDSNRKLVGMISMTDIDKIRTGMSIFKRKNLEELDEAIFRTAVTRYIMTHPVKSISGEANIIEAYKVFKKNRIHALPVLDDDKLVGIVTPIDLLSYFVE